MAAGPEVTQHGPLNIGYGFTPTEYRPQNIEVPSGAGALWAEVGRTALAAAQQAGTMLQNSRLNPAFAAQQDFQQAQYDYGGDVIQNAQDTGQMGYLRSRVTPSGVEVLAPAETGAKFAPLYMPKNPTGKDQNPPPGPKGAPGTGSEPQEETQPETQTSPYGGLEEKKAGGAKQQQKQDSLENPPDTASADTTDTRSASTSDDYLMRMRAERKLLGLDSSGAAQQGTPASMTYTNPATGNVEPLKTDAPSVFASRGGPPAPPAPGGQPQPDTSQTPAAATQGDQAAMAKWQAQNAQQGVMSSQDALAWMKSQTTLAQDATYLPMGGPGGSPAYAFHMKGGGINTVPVSQMVAKGAGPLVAAQNTSMVMSQTDQAQGQGMPSGTGAGAPQPVAQPPPTPMPSGTGMGAPQGTPAPSMPPPAPTAPMPSGTGAGAPQGSPGPAGPPPAPSDYDAAAYQMPQGPTITQNGAVNPALMAGGDDEQALAASRAAAAQPRTDITPLSDSDKAILTPEAIANARANAKPDPNQPANDGGDPSMGDLGPWHLYRDDRNRTNELYAVRPGLSSLFKQQRYYLSSDGWQEYDLPNTNMRLNVEGLFGGGKGSVAGAVMPDGKTFNGKNTFPTMTHDQIAQLSPKAMQGWLNLAGKYTNTNGTANDNMQQRFSGLMDMSQRTQRLIDGNDVAEKENIPTEAYSREAQSRSKAARDRDKIRGLPGNLSNNPLQVIPGALNTGKQQLEDINARGSQVNDFSDYLQEQEKRINDAEKQLPGRQLALQKPESQGTSVSLTGYGLSGTAKLGGDEGESPHEALARMFENTPRPKARAYLQQHKAEIDRQFEQTYQDAISHGYRLSPDVIAYHHAITKGGNIDQNVGGDNNPAIDGNRFRDQNGHLVNPWPMPQQKTAPDLRQELRQSGALPGGSSATGTGTFTASRSGANPSPTPPQTIDTTDSSAVDAFLKNNPQGGQVLNKQGQLRQIRPRSQ